jgi:hypothetical protein
MNAEDAAQLLARTNGWCIIDIYCDDKSHAGGVYPGRDALSFVLDARQDPPRWSMYVESKKWQRGHGTQTAKPPRDVRAVLIGNRRIDDDIEVDPRMREIPGTRTRYRLYCKECTQKRKFGKTRPDQIIDETVLAERLHRVLDVVALNAEQDDDVDCVNPGVLRIGLAELVAKLRSS